ncbi:NAD(P)H-dependent oxidoreductase [Gloeocapsopsis crepidinum LEGE 06123]|uniref:NAD(P)H-dependent oxidoreductase n=1 Tax=Gloeocapsopsis crepidinum LEGE 06123 TaxID=588587 RepID=A0ABR9UYS1_9CHRO|nr:NAD(P)H-dependent oxidoreductase [Gloeocapsopsis crepidinum]MBE9192398.1 NAD(P)H-dependent oxidoreductase [Gloeocapsopsis crepidinum LEGE 06123]
MKNLFIPVILGTTRQGRMSEPVANFIVEQVKQWSSVETELIDIRQLHFPIDNAGQAIKDPQFSATCERADGFILVVPEYNHSFPGWLKHVLDTNLEEYIHKAVGICGVSASPFGGTRVIQSLLPVMRELGLVTTFYDLNFGNVNKLFDESGKITEAEKDAYIRRFERSMKELVWMSTTLRYGRLNISVEVQQVDATPPNCHANKPCPEADTILRVTCSKDEVETTTA